jgi:cysteine protease ATG4
VYPDDDGFIDAGGDMEIEDDWVDPVAAPPAPVPTPSKKKSKGKRKAVPVPSVHYPFPVSVEDVPQPRASGGQRMHTARARDGGRTQSGGVRGVLMED